MNFDFTKIQQQMYKYLVEQKKIDPKENGEIDLSALYALLNMSAPTVDMNSPEGLEYLKDLVTEFMELEYIVTAADDDKNKELSVTEKGDFMNEELELELTAEQLEELFGPEEVETPPPSDGGGGGGGGDGGDGGDKNTGDKTVPTTNGEEEVTGDAKVQKAKDDMDAAEDVYQEAIKELMANDAEFAAMEQDRLATNEQIVAQEEENTALETESQELDVEITRLDSEISACDAEISSLEGQISALKSQVDENGNPPDTSGLEAQLADARQRKADLEADKQAAQDRKGEIDGTLLPNGVKALEDLNAHLQEVEDDINKYLDEKDDAANKAYDDYMAKKDTYETVKAEYDAEQEKIREQALNEEKAKYLEKDKQYDSLSDILLDGSATSDAVKKSVEEAKFDEGADTKYSIGTNGNYSVTGYKDGQEVTIYYDSEGKEVSRRSSSADAIIADRKDQVQTALKSELDLGDEGTLPENIEYELRSDGKIVATVDGKDSYVINDKGEVVGKPLTPKSEEEATTDDDKALNAIYAELGASVTDGNSVNYEKTENGYIVTVKGEDGKETTYTYGMKENADKTKTPVLESSSDATAVLKAAENPELAQQVVGDVETMLANKGQEGTDLEYKIVDGQIVVTSTFGGKDTTYKFDEEGKFIGSSDARDVVSDKDLAKYLNSAFAGEDENYVFKTNEDGTISASINGETHTIDTNGEVIKSDFTSFEKLIEKFSEMTVGIEGADELVANLKDTISKKVTDSGLKLDEGMTYSISSDGNVYVEGTVNGKSVTYGFDATGTLVSSPNLSEIMSEENKETTTKIEEAISGMNIDAENIQYTNTDAGVVAVVTDKEGNKTKVTFNDKGEIVQSSDISQVGKDDSEVQGKVQSAVAELLPENAEVSYQRNEDGSYTVTSISGGVENKYTFNAEGKLTASTDLETLAGKDEEVMENIVSAMRNVGTSIVEKTDDGYILTKIVGEGDSAKEVTFELDAEGNIKDFTNLDDIAGSDFSKSAMEKLSTAGFDTEGAKFNFDDEGNLVVKCKDKETGKDVQITLDYNQNIVSSSTSKGTGLSEEKEKSINDSLASAGVTDTSNCTYKFSESGAVTVTNVQDGVETTYTFDKDGKMTGYENAVGSFEVKTEGEKSTVVFEPAGGGAAVTLNVENLSDAAKLFTPEQLKEIQEQTESLEKAQGDTNTQRIANAYGIEPLQNETYVSSEELAATSEIIDPNDVKPGHLMFTHSGSYGEGAEETQVYNVAVVAQVLDTPEGKAYVTIETDSNGGTRVVIKKVTEEDETFFGQPGNG